MPYAVKNRLNIESIWAYIQAVRLSNIEEGKINGKQGGKVASGSADINNFL